MPRRLRTPDLELQLLALLAALRKKTFPIPAMKKLAFGCFVFSR